MSPCAFILITYSYTDNKRYYLTQLGRITDKSQTAKAETKLCYASLFCLYKFSLIILCTYISVSFSDIPRDVACYVSAASRTVSAVVREEKLV